MMRRKTWFGVGLCATAASVPVADDAWPHQALFEESGKSTEFDLLSKTYSNLVRLFAST